MEIIIFMSILKKKKCSCNRRHERNWKINCQSAKEKYNVYYTGGEKWKIKNYFQLDLSDQASVNNFIKKINKLNF